MEEYSRDRENTYDCIIWRMRIACWVAKATDTQSEYVILTAFPRRQWLREGAQCYVVCTLLVLIFLSFFLSPLLPVFHFAPLEI